MKGPINPELEIGDEIVLFHMEGENSVSPGTKGKVKNIQVDPFEDDNLIISVNWANGSTLALMSKTDVWKKNIKESIKESSDKSWDYIIKNPDIFENFDWKFLREFLYKIRESGIVNIFGSAPLLYSGREHIDRYYGEDQEDNEAFQEVLEMADEAKNKMIQGVVKYMQKHNKNLDDMGQVNRFATNFSQKILGLYMALSAYRD
jgi:hypothetical protein